MTRDRGVPDAHVVLTPATHPPAGGSTRWEPVALRRAAREALTEELLTTARTSPDLRRALVVHPRADAGASGLSPSTQVALEVLQPGEDATPPRRSSWALVLQLSGEADVDVDGVHHGVGPLDVHTVPPLAAQQVTAVGPEPIVRLVFSNAALLEHLGVHLVDPGGTSPHHPADAGDDPTPRNDTGVEPIGDGWRLEYERLIDPPWVPLRARHWAWADVRAELDRVAELDDRYGGRRVCVLHDPVTGRTNGTTATLFASMCVRPAGIVDRPHRHAAAGINQFLQGSGWSTVDGHRIDWEAGDLVFIAPGWATHHHASDDGEVLQLAVQDNPLHLAMGSLVWQEDLAQPPRLLGAEPGFSTNRYLLGRT